MAAASASAVASGPAPVASPAGVASRAQEAAARAKAADSTIRSLRIGNGPVAKRIGEFSAARQALPNRPLPLVMATVGRVRASLPETPTEATMTARTLLAALLLFAPAIHAQPVTTAPEGRIPLLADGIVIDGRLDDA